MLCLIKRDFRVLFNKIIEHIVSSKSMSTFTLMFRNVNISHQKLMNTQALMFEHVNIFYQKIVAIFVNSIVIENECICNLSNDYI